MSPSLRSVLLTALGLLLPIGRAAAQSANGNGSGDPLLVFMDCKAPNCDFDHFRREIAWVSWVNDRVDADVHVLTTSQSTGGGGRLYTLDYIGQKTFQDVTKRLTFTSDPDAMDAEVREVLTRTLKIGLVHFVDRTPVANQLDVVYRAPSVGPGSPQSQVHDPWNLWTFQISANGSLEGEASQSGYSVRGSARGNRVTDAIKVNLSLSGRYSRDEYEFEEGSAFVNTSESYSASSSMTWSMGSHWSAGWAAEARRSTFYNYALTTSAGPRVEYDIFPYNESTRRLVTVRYGVELARFDYMEETVEGKLNQLLPRHSLGVSASLQQPWGRIQGTISGDQYLHDLATHRIDTFAVIEYRIFRGLSLNMFGSVSRIKDQFYLPKEDLTDEEVLLRRKQRETNFSYWISGGISYRFGSKFSNIVNPRMGNDGGEDIMIIF